MSSSIFRGFMQVDRSRFFRWLCSLQTSAAFLMLVSSSIAAFQENTDPSSAEQRQISQDLIRNAFRIAHDGWSVDEVLLDDLRREKFLLEASRLTGCQDEASLLEAIVKVRKGGGLQVRTTRRNREDVSEAMPAAEIASRRMQDEYGILIDDILIDPRYRAEFDGLALAVMPDETPYRLRKAALRLRKSRQLTPELTLRVVDWKREILKMTVDEARQDITMVPRKAGIYLFFDATGYLYIGQSNNLRERLTKHLQDSDRKSLTRYLSEHTEHPIHLELHVFEETSPANETFVREAYESELIRSRKPRLNLSP